MILIKYNFRVLLICWQLFSDLSLCSNVLLTMFTFLPENAVHFLDGKIGDSCNKKLTLIANFAHFGYHFDEPLSIEKRVL